IATLLAAIFSSALGVGGGILLVPLLHSVGKLEFKNATSTSITLIIPISYLGAISHLLMNFRNFPVEILSLFLPACMVGALLGKLLIGKFNNLFVKFVFSLFLIVISAKLLNFFDLFDHFILVGNITNHLNIIVFFYGIFISAISVSLGVGGGLITVPFLHLVCNLSLPNSIAISLLSVAVISTIGTAVLRTTKYFDKMTIRSLIPFCITGASLGALISQQTPEYYLKKIFAIFILVVGVMYLKSILKDIKEQFVYEY
ncbi:MAG: sulfite exporter TauE/SafE family protein, partial [Oligoflexia bacterium]|nr:sulfite exporter TauE/SafE family protein [Oligoflexia bacterium]